MAFKIFKKKKEPETVYSMTPRHGHSQDVFDENGIRQVAGCLPIDPINKRFLLISASNHPDTWVIPKGGWEKDETQKQAAIRETWEEAGVKGIITRHIGVFAEKSEKGIKAHHWIYEMEIKEVTKKFPEQKKRERRWFTYDEAMLAVKAYYIQDALSMSSISPLVHPYEEKKKKKNKKKKEKNQDDEESNTEEEDGEKKKKKDKKKDDEDSTNDLDDDEVNEKKKKKNQDNNKESLEEQTHLAKTSSTGGNSAEMDQLNKQFNQTNLNGTQQVYPQQHPQQSSQYRPVNPQQYPQQPGQVRPVNPQQYSQQPGQVRPVYPQQHPQQAPQYRPVNPQQYPQQYPQQPTQFRPMNPQQHQQQSPQHRPMAPLQ